MHCFSVLCLLVLMNSSTGAFRAETVQNRRSLTAVEVSGIGTEKLSEAVTEPRRREEEEGTVHKEVGLEDKELMMEDEEQAFQVEREKTVKQYRILTSAEIYSQIQDWKYNYTDFLRVTTSQEKYGLQTAGTSSDCLFDTDNPSDGCRNFILEIQDYAVHPVGSESSNNLASVFWSGCLHGNERVGPTATMEAVGLLLEAAKCESTVDRKCRAVLKSKGIDDAHRKWLARLVTTRRLIVVPTSNALGYYQNRREEGRIDPNRDFPYDLKDDTKCMQTIAGRTLNEIYRENLFQLALTFHGGMEVIGYEWGAPTWLNHLSPDDIAQESIAAAYSRYAGGWTRTQPYEYGTMNDEVYYVRGGMEDWAYAGSWDTQRVIQCNPNTFGGYPKEKTVYNNSTLRVFNMLVETSNKKEPHMSSLGTSLDVMERATAGNGHVSRNIRLALLAAEFVEPYVSLLGVNEVVLQDDLPPTILRDGRSCQRSKAVSIARDATEIEIQFTVGGALTIDNVDLWFAKWDDIPKEQLDCLSQPKSLEGFQKGTILGPMQGTGAFSTNGASPQPEGMNRNAFEAATIGPMFRGKIAVPRGLKSLDRLVVLASARVDQDWTNGRSNVEPKVEPQSHIVNARTNPDWHYESSGKHIHGRLDWFSSPLTVIIGDFSEGLGTHDGDSLIQTVEMYPRFSSGADKSGLKPKSATDDQFWFPVHGWYAFAGFLAALVFCLFCTLRQNQRHYQHHLEELKTFDNDYDQDDGFSFDPKPYSDGDEELDDDDLNDSVELPVLP